MCGIVGYIGTRACYPVLLKGLQRLEYRGYDSAGIAVLHNGLHVYKKAGKVKNLVKFTEGKNITSTIGIGHTRWATHGAPNNVNAHPHVASSGKLAIVHNGIIENYTTLKQALTNKGYTFKSGTDTEILVQFIEDIQKCNQYTLEEAVRLALTKIIGAYAIVVMSEDYPNMLIAARKGSPLVIGIGEKELFIASDAASIVEYTNQVVFLKEQEMVIMQKDKFTIKDLGNTPITPYIQKLNMSLAAIEKGGYDYFMLKEIMEQPKSVAESMRGRLDSNNKKLVLGGLTQYIDQLVHADKITIVACGTSWHAGLVAEYFIEALCRIPVEVEYASEFRYRNPIIKPKDIVIAISQSGETADTLAAVTLAKEKGATIIGICNVVESSIARISHAGIYIHAGPEIGVASTKAFTSQLIVLMMMALEVARERKTITIPYFEELLHELASIPTKIETVLQQDAQIKHIASLFKEVTNCLYLGRGYNFPVALEGALKLKELSYVHAEGYPAAEMKHGAIALIDKNMPVIFIATQDSSYDKIISNMESVKARNGKIIAIVTKGDNRASELADYVITVPTTHEALMPVISVIPLQLFSYHMAVFRNCNVDQPRNLAKSVTVE